MGVGGDIGVWGGGVILTFNHARGSHPKVLGDTHTPTRVLIAIPAAGAGGLDIIMHMFGGFV